MNRIALITSSIACVAALSGKPATAGAGLQE